LVVGFTFGLQVPASITGAPLSVDGTNAAWAVVDYMYRALAGI
jgi:hypothetical protein